MAVKKGTRIRLLAKPDWGLGELVEDGSTNSLRVFFENAGVRQLAPSLAKYEVISGAAAKSAILDNLSVKALQPGARYFSVRHAIERFLELYPGGFYGEEYKSRERTYKAKASNLAKELLDAKVTGKKRQRGEYGEICLDALRVVNATNLIFPNEKMTLKDGLKSKQSSKRFAEGLCDLLAQPDLDETRFTRFAVVLQDIGAGKCTIASYFPYLVFPQAHMFVKPTVTQKAAELSAFDLNYKPDLNWFTYERVLEFSRRLRNDLKDLKPRDMIDVQSFMWCIAPEI